MTEIDSAYTELYSLTSWYHVVHVGTYPLVPHNRRDSPSWHPSSIHPLDFGKVGRTYTMSFAPPMPSRGESKTSYASCASESCQSEWSDVYGTFEDDVGDDTRQEDALKPIVMSGVDLAMVQEQQIGHVASIFELPRPTASALLRKFRWNDEKLTQALLEDAGKTLRDAGLGDDEAEDSAKRQRPADEGGSTFAVAPARFECSVCFSECAPSDTSALCCGHRFCNDCWGGHLKAQLGDGLANGVTCMGERCGTLVDPSLAQALLEPSMYAKFARFTAQQFVDDAPNLRWCPAAGCERVLKLRELACDECACPCGMVFCAKCSREWHYPLTCEVLTRWEDKVASDSATGQWFEAHAKRCRKCLSHIEKNGGCNWITCRCGHQFCFFCFSEDRSHHGQPCNAPPPPEAHDAQHELAYFMHYLDRYNGHKKSQELEAALREGAASRIEAELARGGSSHTAIELDYLRESVEVLIQCRRLLTNTYPFAFYVPRGNAKELFEDLQARLEGATERLSMLLEEEGAPDKTSVLLLKDEASRRMLNMRAAFETGEREPSMWGQHQQHGAAALTVCERPGRADAARRMHAADLRMPSIQLV